MIKANNITKAMIDPEQHARSACLYVRQSSLAQVRNHTESTRRQYQLAEWLHQAGWAPERVEVIDEDQGRSGSVARARSGFAGLATSVARGEFGIVAALEFSRLARNSPDWHNLVYLCRWSGTLVADETGVYDPQVATDRAMLGIRGQMSEPELDAIVHRMQAARLSKAERGELETIPPAGCERDELGRLVVDPDESVAQAIRMVFAKFDELGAARQVRAWWAAQGLKYPVRRVELRGHPVVWLAPEYKLVLGTLYHLTYSGSFVY